MSSPIELDPAVIHAAVAGALDEDLGSIGDLTSDNLFPTGRRGRARLVAREELSLAGMPLAREVFRQVDPRVKFEAQAEDGARCLAGSIVAWVEGPAASLLKGERTALNFLMRMSGVASAAFLATQEIEGTGAKILDTRKTLPGWRVLDKYSVRCGGAHNHRMGLFDEAMIKDTHLEAVDSIAVAVEAILKAGVPAHKITVEVRDLDQLKQAIDAGAGRALLDNMSVAELAEAVTCAAKRIVLEASGGLTLGTLRPVAETGVDYLSLGALTHSSPAADLAMEMESSR